MIVKSRVKNVQSECQFMRDFIGYQHSMQMEGFSLANFTAACMSLAGEDPSESNRALSGERTVPPVTRNVIRRYITEHLSSKSEEADVELVMVSAEMSFGGPSPERWHFRLV